MKGVILAAGRGTRLPLPAGHLHKLLLPASGRSVIDYTLDAYRAAGIEEVAIIVGYRGNVLMEQISDGSRHGLRIEYLYNPDYHRGNALSVYRARVFTGDEPFLLSMADHMVSPGLLSRVHESRGHESVLAVDFDELALERDEAMREATRVFVSPDGLVTRIGKGLSRWNGIDAGVFRLALPIYDSIAELVREERVEYELGEAVARMLGKGHPLQACDISGCFWRDIDTWDDLEDAREVLSREKPWP